MMLKLRGTYQKAKHLPGNTKTLLVEFTTTQGTLPIIVSSEQWMKFFVNDEAPEPNSRWELTLDVVAVPELEKTMLSLSEAKIAPSAGTSEDSAVVAILEKIYHRLNDLGIVSTVNSCDASYYDQNHEQATSKLSTSEDELVSLGNNYQPKLETTATDNDDTNVVNDPKIKDHSFNLNSQRPKKLLPSQQAVDQGTGDSVTNNFFDQDTEQESVEEQKKDVNTDPTEAEVPDSTNTDDNAPQLDFGASDDLSGGF